MRRVVLPVLLLSTLPMFADDVSKRAKVEEMLHLSKIDTISQQMLAAIPARVKNVASRQALAQQASTADQKKITDDYLQRMVEITQKGATWDAVHARLVDLYLAAFTEPELDSIVAFYKTPAGQTLVTKTPELSSKTVELLQSAVNALEPEFKAATLAYETNMKNAAPSAAPPTLGPGVPANTAPPTLKPRQ